MLAFLCGFVTGFLVAVAVWYAWRILSLFGRPL